MKNLQVLTELFNDYFVSIVETTTGKPPPSCKEKVKIPEARHSKHPRIQQIRYKFSDRMPFLIPFASGEDVYDISSVDTIKGAGYDTIPAKLIKISTGVITKPITNINLTIQACTDPELLKTATVSPVLKKKIHLPRRASDHIAY